MQWPVEKAVIIPAIRNGFLIRPFQSGDEYGLLQLRHLAGECLDCSEEDVGRTALDQVVNGGLFLAIKQDTGQIVGSAIAKDNASSYPFHGGSLHAVFVDPAFRGFHLGAGLAATVTHHLVEAAYTDIFLTTDDHRLPALKTYLGLGWSPIVFDKEHEERWRSVFSKLGMEATKL